MAKLLRNSTTEEVMIKNGNGSMEMIKGVTEEVKMKNCNKGEVIRGMTEEVRGVSSVTYDLTLVCKGGATVRKIHQNHSLVILITKVILLSSISPSSCPPGRGL